MHAGMLVPSLLRQGSSLKQVNSFCQGTFKQRLEVIQVF